MVNAKVRAQFRVRALVRIRAMVSIKVRHVSEPYS